MLVVQVDAVDVKPFQTAFARISDVFRVSADIHIAAVIATDGEFCGDLDLLTDSLYCLDRGRKTEYGMEIGMRDEG